MPGDVLLGEGLEPAHELFQDWILRPCAVDDKSIIIQRENETTGEDADGARFATKRFQRGRASVGSMPVEILIALIRRRRSGLSPRNALSSGLSCMALIKSYGDMKLFVAGA